MIDNSQKIKNVLSNEIMNHMVLNQEKMMEILKNGFQGYESMKLDEVTNIFVEMFGWAKYGEVVSKFTDGYKNQKFIAYFDSSYIQQTKEGYISYVIKTSDNELIFRDALEVNIKNIYIGESLALLRLLDKAIELDIANIEVYGDNQGLIDKVNRRKGGVKGFNAYLPAIANRIDKFDDVSVVWSNRGENKYADMLCRLKRRGADVKKQGGMFNFDELLKLSSRKVG